MAKNRTPAVAYIRTSSATNVGEGKDSLRRQRDAISRYAKRAGIELREPPFYDPAVSGADPIDTRPGFASLLAYLRENLDVRTILVETANRFARDLIVQETGYRMLQAKGIQLVAVDSPESFVDDTPTADLIRQILGAVAQFDKAMTVSRLRAARERLRAANGKCAGRKSLREARPEAVAMARRLRRRGKTLRDISAALAKAGHVNGRGKAYQPTAVKSLVEGPQHKPARSERVDMGVGARIAFSGSRARGQG